MNNDIQFQIEGLSSELVALLMKRYGWSMKRALDELFLLKPISGFATRIVVYTMKVLYMNILKYPLEQKLRRGVEWFILSLPPSEFLKYINEFLYLVVLAL